MGSSTVGRLVLTAWTEPLSNPIIAVTTCLSSSSLSRFYGNCRLFTLVEKGVVEPKSVPFVLVLVSGLRQPFCLQLQYRVTAISAIVFKGEPVGVWELVLISQCVVLSGCDG